MNLWPSYTRNESSLRWDLHSIESIEQFFSNYYGFDCVLFSSARAAIRATLIHLNFSRSDLVWIPPFSSHCLFNTMGTVCTPTIDISSPNLSAYLVYHQYGHEFKLGPTTSHSATILEDSVDSMVTNKNALFPNSGEFEFFSLPKIIGSLMGGIVVCKRSESATSLRKVRSLGSSFVPFMQQTLKILSQYNETANLYCSSFEPFNTSVSFYSAADILGRLPDWNHIIELRQERIERVLKSKISLAHSLTEGRLPCALTMAKDSRNFIQRHMLKKQDDVTNSIIKVSMIPTHHQIKISELDDVLSSLEDA